MSRYTCDLCRRSMNGARLLWRCPCGGPVTLRHAGRIDPEGLASRPRTIWRYREAMGIAADIKEVTLGEGFTPILDRRIENLSVRLKLESLMPTGSFKDRGASLVISHLAAAGVTTAVEDSSGNAGLAMAAYGSRAGIRVEVLVPEDSPPTKLAAIEACGGHLRRVPGGRAAAAAEALRRAERGVPFASHCWNPFFIEGTKSLAFEIWEQTRPAPPARIFFPVGNGTLLLGAYDGFTLLCEQGLLQRPPHLMAVQAAACAPLLDAPPAPAGETIADGIRVRAPVRERRIREALARTGGRALAVQEEEIVAAHRVLGLAGVDVEPTSATAFAGALRWMRDAVPAEQRASEQPPLILLTGSGLKAAP